MSEVAAILAAITDLKTDFRDYKTTNETKLEKMDTRIAIIEKWQISFVTKLSIYSAAALFLGSIIAQVGIHLLTNYISK